jgi:hypothetical protein
VRAEDLREPVLEGARRGLWDHYGLGSEVALASAVFQRIYDSDLKPMLKRNICWWLLCALQGVDAKLGRDLRADVRRACREMGLTPDVGLDAHLPKQPVLVRLDYDQGAQVTTAVPPPTTGEYLASIVQKSA